MLRLGFGNVTFDPFLKKSVNNTGIITRATNSDDARTIIKVSGMYDINSPIILFQKSRGKKAARVVAVDDIIGIATSPVACLAASSKG